MILINTSINYNLNFKAVCFQIKTEQLWKYIHNQIPWKAQSRIREGFKVNMAEKWEIKYNLLSWIGVGRKWVIWGDKGCLKQFQQWKIGTWLTPASKPGRINASIFSLFLKPSLINRPKLAIFIIRGLAIVKFLVHGQTKPTLLCSPIGWHFVSTNYQPIGE